MKKKNLENIVGINSAFTLPFLMSTDILIEFLGFIETKIFKNGAEKSPTTTANFK